MIPSSRYSRFRLAPLFEICNLEFLIVGFSIRVICYAAFPKGALDFSLSKRRSQDTPIAQVSGLVLQSMQSPDCYD
ncbi:hypothetical protein [uncultured Algoriphagus sp.]|uniref:hypothetical protein n=1 Tax=uncultured Algoriphagus sp. TaxID=417365 RepID=UPI00258FED7B|nr:hypothetical protein [uncultured Algoriphagus sp.]